jgi:glycosyltransferase involved in cell wall biosynthesis
MLKDIIFVNDYATINGGLAKLAIDGAIGLGAIGAKVTFIAASGPVADRLAASGVDVRCMNQPDIWDEPNRALAMARGIWNGSAMEYIRTQLKDFDPATSIIHCQGFSRALSPAIGKLMIDGGFRHVYSMHDNMLACPNGTFFHHREQAICKRPALGLACLTTNCDARAPYHKLWRVTRQVVAKAVAGIPQGFKDLIYTSELHRGVIEPYLNPASRLHYVANPISVDKGPRVKAEDNDIFLFVSRLVPEKGAVLFAEAAKRAGVKAVFVGDGPEREKVEAIYPQAHVTGWVSPAEVEMWLSRARCLVFPSIWYDASPLTVRESLAKGVPVICGGWNAGSEAISDGRTGYVADNSDPATWQALMARLDGNVAELSAHAYDDYWANPVGLTEHARRLLEVYEIAMSNQ